ncbi:MAG: hypothetical protein IKP62_05685 [Salinivirgaceae bacterium]|nr:hypothetical protein [Salinivirgaceae bacterium]
MKKILIITRNPIVNTRQMENTGGVSRDGKYQFVINDWDCKPDFVVVNGKAVRETRMFDVPKSRTILLTDEPYSVLAYPKGYYRQFGTVITNQQEIKPINGTNVIHTHTFLPWYVGMTWEPDHSNRITLDYNQIKKANPVKEKLMSVVSSYKTCSAGHVARRRFVNRLMARYGDKVELFGERVNDFRDKWDVTAPYKYQIVIENCCNKDYWTEKIADCFLAGTYPIYCGCTNIGDYFPKGAYTEIDVREPEKAMEIIDKVIADDLFSKHQAELAESKQLVMNDYNMFNRLAEICAGITDESEGQTTINPAKRYLSAHNLYLHLIGRTLHQLSYKIKK